ncbi:MAG: 50S ribosomal protein L3 [Candidatus Diapherotrites archaeon]
MTKKHKPHSGSKAYYPRKRAAKETPSFSTFPNVKDKDARPMNFLGYKAGMVHLLAKDLHEKSTSYNQEIIVPSTAIECPPMKVFGIRAYAKTPYGLKTIGDVIADKTDKSLMRKINSFKKKSKKKGKKEGKDSKQGEKEEKIAENAVKKFSISDLENKKESIYELKLLVHTQPGLTGIGKKRPDLIELALSGSFDSQLEFAKQKLGNEIRVSEIFERANFVDVRAVDKGKGFQGVIKRFGVKMQRPKAKKRRIVGSIGPWNPSTVMWQVARAGQMGYQSRTEYNKRVVEIGEDASNVNPSGGFKNYGEIKNEFILLAGSVPGPVKRAIALRIPIRPEPHERFHLGEISYYSSSQKGKKKEVKGEVKGEKAHEKKEDKKHEAKKGDKKEVKKEAPKTEAKEEVKKEGKKEKAEKVEKGDKKAEKKKK